MGHNYVARFFLVEIIFTLSITRLQAADALTKVAPVRIIVVSGGGLNPLLKCCHLLSIKAASSYYCRHPFASRSKYIRPGELQ